MTAEGVAAEVREAEVGDGQPLFCYRHPDRETYVRCGRCDRPICTRCAMQGPVGFRCKECGKPRNDPLTSFTTPQLALGSLAAIAGGAIGGFVGTRIGIFAIFIGFFAGGLIADLVMRFTGYKRGPVMVTILLGGIALGTLIGAGGEYWLFNAQLQQAMAGAGGDEAELSLTFLEYVQLAAPWLVIWAGAAMAGAWGRLRF